MNTSMSPLTFSLCSIHPAFLRRHYGARCSSFAASWLSLGSDEEQRGRLGAFHRFVEALVESSALYSVSLILFLAFAIRDDLRMHYFDIVAGIVKVREQFRVRYRLLSIVQGIAPTLLVGRITAGYRAHLDDSWQGSVMASASIGSRSQEHSRTSFREASPMLDGDLEAQHEISLRVNIFASITSLSRTETRYSFLRNVR